MSRTIIGVVAFGAGLAVGLLVAQVYARTKVQSGIDSTLSRFGLGGGAIQSTADSLVPVLTG